MTRLLKIALQPGTIEYAGEKKVEKVRITYMDYDGDRFQEKEVQAVEACFPFRDTPTVTWMNIDGLHETEHLQKLGTHVGLHPLVMQDIVNTQQRPKMEDYQDYIYMVFRILSYEEESRQVSSEQISIVLIYFRDRLRNSPTACPAMSYGLVSAAQLMSWLRSPRNRRTPRSPGSSLRALIEPVVYYPIITCRVS